MSRRGHSSMKIDSSHHQQAPAAFNFDQMHNTIDNIEASTVEVPKKSSSSRSKHVTDMSSAEAIHVAASAAANGKAIEVAAGNNSHSSNGKLVAAASSSGGGGGNPDKKVKYKSLWGKVGKHGLMQAAASKTSQNQDSASSGSSSTGSASNRNKRGSATTSGWDQVLQPIMQKQQQQQSYGHYNYHAQQVQMGSASTGSGWTGANMECDCGEDTCPRCNLLLSMGDDQQW